MKNTGRVVARGRLTTASAVVAAIVAAGSLTATAAYAATPSVTAPALSVNQPILHEGSQGPAVKNWQALIDQLAARGEPSQPAIAVDGIFGPMTKAATENFQRWAHIIVDGIVGPQTRASASLAVSSAALDTRSHLKPTLSEGSQGAAVKDWQATLDKLASQGKPSQPAIAVDGIFGPKTKAATENFQRWAHLTANGIVGVDTYGAAAQSGG
jgi:peptidoglycan hydrolase-like protein with peptidoglycan-binding domain